MFNTTEKRERSLGINLGLKAHRCNSPKCVMTRNPQKPGPHVKARRRGNVSEFSQQLREKQKVKALYGIRDTAMRHVFIKAAKHLGATGEMMIVILEQRLDNVVFRLGFAPSRAMARQLISHGHIMMNGRKVTIPSIQVKVGDVISIRKQSMDHPLFKDLRETLKSYNAPVWVKMDIEKLEGSMTAKPKDFEVPVDLNLIVDYYSKIQ